MPADSLKTFLLQERSKTDGSADIGMDPAIFVGLIFEVNHYPAAVLAGGMWESRVLCGISKRSGNGGKVGVGLFHGFHGAAFAQPSSGFCGILAGMPAGFLFALCFLFPEITHR